MLHHHHLAKDEGAAFLLVASLASRAQTSVLREPSLVAKELSYWFNFLQSVRSSSQDEEKPPEVCVVLTHKDCCRGFDAERYSNDLKRELARLLGYWPGGTRIFFINAMNPGDATKVFEWLYDVHERIAAGATPIPRLCKELEKTLNILRRQRAAKVSASSCVCSQLNCSARR